MSFLESLVGKSCIARKYPGITVFEELLSSLSSWDLRLKKSKEILPMVYYLFYYVVLLL